MSKDMGERIKLARRLAKMEQKDLAKALLLSIGTISRWERGITEPSKAELNAIAAYADTSAYWLATGDGSMSEHKSVQPFQAEPNSLDAALNGIAPHTGEAKPKPHPHAGMSFVERLESLKRPSRVLLEEMLEDCFNRIRKNEDLTDDEIARAIQVLREIEGG
jgi:transcriptional regulator with XRE-family HTH domain